MDSIDFGHYQQDIDGDGEENTGDEDSKYRILRHIERINGGLKPGAKITVIGQVLPDVYRIDIDLCERTIGRLKILHFNPRFDWASERNRRNVVVRNSFSDTGWGIEERERSGENFPFKKGQIFKLDIRCEKNQFHFSIDDAEFCTFKYRQPLANAKYLRVLGGINVIHVDIRN